MTNKEKVIITYLTAFFIYATFILFVVQGQELNIYDRALIVICTSLPTYAATMICDLNGWFKKD